MNRPKQDPLKLVRDHKYWRIIEMIPGALTWAAFLSVIIGSLFNPYITANIIIIYTLIWVFRAYFFTYYLAQSYQYSRRAQKTDWKGLIELIEKPKKLEKLVTEQKYEHDPLVFKLKRQPLEPYLLKRINKMQEDGEYLKPSDVMHCISLPSWKEPHEVIRASVQSYVECDFDVKNKVILQLALEERDKENALKIADKIVKEYKGKFKDILISVHPKDLPGEHVGRAANASWAAKQLIEYAKEHKINIDNLVLSTFDADTAVSPQYLNELTFRFAATPNRVEVGYQPVPFYHNNFWDVPIFNRLVAISCSFWQWSVSNRKDENKSFSSRAMSLQSVIDFNFWDSQVVQDDSRQYWTAFFVYNGRHYLENIYSPIYMDAVQSDTYVKTVKSQYIQLQRWAWGASDLPFIVFNILPNKHITWDRKLYEIFHFIESVFFWATGPILLIFAGSIPSLINS